MKTIDFSGVSTALITPMRDDKVDFEALARVVEMQVESGIAALVAVGTTGESPTLSAEEHLEVIRKTVQFAAGRVPVIAGTGSNSTAEAVKYTREADAAGADAHLQVSPYYNKPSQEGLFQHFSAVAQATEKPIMLYSIPSRCVIDIGVKVCQRLLEKHPHVYAIKEAGGSCDKVVALQGVLGPDYQILSGDDNMTLPFMAVGGRGVVSVASNLLPAEVVGMVRHAQEGRWGEAQAVHARLAALFRDLFIEPNPVPVKYLMKQAGIIPSAEVRLPLCALSGESREKLVETYHLLRGGESR